MSLAITICHHSASLMMPVSDPQDGFFYPTLTLRMDSYILYPHLIHLICFSARSDVFSDSIDLILKHNIIFIKKFLDDF